MLNNSVTHYHEDTRHKTNAVISYFRWYFGFFSTQPRSVLQVRGASLCRMFTDARDRIRFGRSQLEESLLESPGLLGILAFKS